MKVQLEDGREFRVTFVHSSVKPAPAAAFVASGSVRQFVENIAYILRRRVTLCQISQILPTEFDPFLTGAATTDVPCGQGLSVCHWRDNFNKKIGRDESFKRALACAKLDEDARFCLSDLVGIRVDHE